MKLSDLPHISSPLPWHERDWTELSEQLDHGKMPHALLLVGSKHTGNSQLALALARLLLCSHPEGSLNCGHCHACNLTAGASHGDFRWVSPEEKSRVIKIEQIRDVVRFTNKTAGFGLRKVIVFAPADCMNAYAFNALLKSLEEPAKDTYLILVCHSLHVVPATIRSRCQIKHLASPDTERCLDWLNKTTGSSEKSQELLNLADNLPLLALQLHDCGSADEFAKRLFGLQALLRGHITVPQAGALWSEIDVGTFLEQLASDLQRHLGSLSLDLLTTKQGKDAFRLMDDVARLQQAVNVGANPSKHLLIDALLSRYCRELGTGLLGDNIQLKTGETGI